MLEISGKKDQVVLENKKVTERVKFSNLENCTIQNVDFSSNESDHMVNATNLKNCKFINCKFHGKSTKGVAMNMSGAGTKGNVFDGCEWYDLTFSAGNGGEPLRLGNSQYSGCWFNCTVKNCYFHDLKADVETISNKSCGNIVENCKFENNESNITVRHGGFATIRNNTFKGKGGIRVYGYGNVITGNTFKDNPNDGKFAPIIIGAGTAEKDPNFTAPDKPIGKEGQSHAIYAQVNHNTIKDNTFQNCKINIRVRTDHPLRAKDSEITDKPPSSSSTTTPTPTPPPPSTPTPPTTEEPPTTTTPPPPSPPSPPGPTTTPVGSECALGDGKAIKYRVTASLYVCEDHKDAAQKALQDAVNGVKKQLASQSS